MRSSSRATSITAFRRNHPTLNRRQRLGIGYGAGWRRKDSVHHGPLPAAPARWSWPAPLAGGLLTVAITVYWQHGVPDDRTRPVVTWYAHMCLPGPWYSSHEPS